MIRRRLKDDTVDPFDYPDDENATNKLLIALITTFVIGVVAVVGIVALILEYADVIDNALK